MYISKAIEILNHYPDPDEIYSDPDFMDAIKLGIEALKRVKGNRLYPQPDVYPLLPGETEDNAHVGTPRNLSEFLDLPVFDLEDWDYIAPAEGNIDIYAKGNERVLTDRATGRLVTRYNR